MSVDNQILADLYAQFLDMVKWHLADFSEADMLARPCGAANHAAWQVGHMAVAEANLINAAMPGAVPEPTAQQKLWHDKANATATSGFPTKEELLKTFGATRERSIAWVKSLSAGDMAKPMPESLRPFAATVGHLAHILPTHDAMHIGQIQVIRRSLGKPRLF
jgi:hypothetical protein